MGALILIAMAAAPVPSAAPDVPDGPSRWRPFIEEASHRFAIPVPWIERVMMAESGGRLMHSGRPIRSRAGAIGLMQLMPATWADMREAYHLGADADDPHDNILAGTAYLHLMYARFGYPGLFAAYNAGPARYALSLSTGRRLPDETLAYLGTVTGNVATWQIDRTRQALQRLFVVRHEQMSDARPETDRLGSASLFALGSVTP